MATALKFTKSELYAQERAFLDVQFARIRRLHERMDDDDAQNLLDELVAFVAKQEADFADCLPANDDHAEQRRYFEATR